MMRIGSLSTGSVLFLASLVALGCSGAPSTAGTTNGAALDSDGGTSSAPGTDPGTDPGTTPPPSGSDDAGSPSDPSTASDASTPDGSRAPLPDGASPAPLPDGAAPTGFVHPGILVNRAMLDFVKAKIAAGAAPWKAAFDSTSSDSTFGPTTYTPHPRADVDCGASSMPDNGCTDEKNDAIAAYTQALLWYHTGDQAHADAAIRIMNAWSSTLQEHTNANAPLQSAWVAEMFPRAAEIIRYTNAGWAAADVTQFESMLKKAYLPEVINGSTVNGNWDTSMIEAMMNIAIFLDDTVTFQKAVTYWKERTPAYVYLTSDGALPVQPPRDTKSTSALTTYWYSPTAFIDGLAQESCRDLPNSGTQGFGHAQYGVAGIVNAAETALIQGVDLYSGEQTRLVAMAELHAKYMNGASTGGLCKTAIAAVGPDPMWEILYNEYANVRGQAMPETLKLVLANRPTSATHHMAWETLTHAEIGAAGL